MMKRNERSALVFNIQKFSVHDGPGIRTTVFLKGCPLQCCWCANPESISRHSELGVIRSRCNNCGKCVEICPEGAIGYDTGHIVQFDRGSCIACGKCVVVCSPGALTIYGKEATIDDVIKDASRDKSFYDGSGGGITASGGEPLHQGDFVTALFEACHEAGIHTCLDTSGYVPKEKLIEALRHTDHVLYDIKHMDPDAHRRFTGRSNELILRNARVVAESDVPLLCRIPLITGVNDTTHNITETARFVKTLRDDISIELLAYHRLGVGKYQTLDKRYQGAAFAAPSPEQVQFIKRIFEDHGLRCTASE
jgi:pyruvate formate lyase activating enzyme